MFRAFLKLWTMIIIIKIIMEVINKMGEEEEKGLSAHLNKMLM